MPHNGKILHIQTQQTAEGTDVMHARQLPSVDSTKKKVLNSFPEIFFVFFFSSLLKYISADYRQTAQWERATVMHTQLYPKI